MTDGKQLVCSKKAKLERVADALAVAVAVALPWSISATGILITAWLIAFLATVNLVVLRRTIEDPAAVVPIALCVAAALGMLWADSAWSERLSEFKPYLRLLVIPLLLMHFQRSDRGPWVLVGFTLSCSVLLVLSWLQWFIPELAFQGKPAGVPVKDYIIQGGEFLICAFGLSHLSIDAWSGKRRCAALLLALAALLFIANIAFVAAARSVIIVFALFLILFGFQRFGIKGAFGAALVVVLFASVAWTSSPHLRERVHSAFKEVREYQVRKAETSAGYRLEFWTKSVQIIFQSPMIGHGTGSVYEQFRRAAELESDQRIFAVTNNPHNQTFIVAIQLGVLGVALLYALWGVHLMMFRGEGLFRWLGSALIAHNIGAGLFNSQLFEATLGWVYIFGVGILGGMVRQQQQEWSQQKSHSNH